MVSSKEKTSRKLLEFGIGLRSIAFTDALAQEIKAS